MHIVIRTVPFSEMRYSGTVGDWVFVDDNNLQITVADLSNWQCEALVGLHELIEALLCRDRGISGEAVDAFDRTFAGDGEPGAAADSPYRAEHLMATSFEMQLAALLGVSWPEYEDKIEAVSEARAQTETPPTAAPR
jgi:hypothetical protein